MLKPSLLTYIFYGPMACDEETAGETRTPETYVMNPTLLVMAAGMGRRYGGLKQVDAVGPGGETLIEYSIYDAIRAGFEKVVFVIRQDIESAFKNTIGKRVQGTIAAEYVYQELGHLSSPFAVRSRVRKPWGTAQAVLMAEGAITEPFAAINADNFYGATSFTLLADHLRTMTDRDDADYAMVGFVLRDTLSEFGGVSRAICRLNAEGFLENVTELSGITPDGDRARCIDETGQRFSLSGDETVSRNMWGFTPLIFTHLRREWIDFVEERGRDETSELVIPTIVNTLIAKGLARVKVLPSDEQGFGITYREDRPRLITRIEDLIARGIYPKRLWR